MWFLLKSPDISSMKFGLRKPSIKKRIAARTSVKRYLRHNLGMKAPRGWVTNPKKAAYNRVYNRTSFSIDRLFGGGKSGGAEGFVLLLLFGVVILAIYILVVAIKGIFHFIVGPREEAETLNDGQTKEAIFSGPHLNSSSDLSCPRCMQPMIRRTAQKGRNPGSQFWGYSRFPSCRGTRSA